MFRAMFHNEESDVTVYMRRGKYKDKRRCHSDVTNVLKQYPDLRPKFDKPPFEGGPKKNLLYLYGTVPVPYQGSNYNIPISIWILDTHPQHAPKVYVCPTEDMSIRSGLHVDDTGKVYLPYLSDWGNGTSDLQGMISRLIVMFSDMPPVWNHMTMRSATPRRGGAAAATIPTPSRSGAIENNCQGNKKALLIGINYFGQSGQLKGCINDVTNVKKLIMTRGFPESSAHMRVLHEGTTSINPCTQPTRKNIIEGIQWLLRGAQPTDSLFLHYSGHGGQTFDLNGDEEDGQDEFICPVDGGIIVDDELKALLSKHLPEGVRLTVVFDSCCSQTALDLPITYDCQGNIKRQTRSSVKSGKSKAKGTKKQARSIKGDVVMIAACKDSQSTPDTYIPGFGNTGKCSYALFKALSRGGNPTYKEVLLTMREHNEMTQMSTNVEMDMNVPFVI